MVAGEGGWLEAPRSRWWPCSAVSFVQICSLAVRGSAVPKEMHPMHGVAPEQTSFGKQLIVLRLWWSAQLRG